MDCTCLKNNEFEVLLDENESRYSRQKRKEKKYFVLIGIGILLLGIGFTLIFTLLLDNKNSSKSNNVNQNIAQACSVYCYGDILDTVQRSGLYNDSKTFPDMPMKHDPDEIWSLWERSNLSTINQLKDFISENFDEVGSDLQSVTPNDFILYPNMISNINNISYQNWAYELNSIWLNLCKTVNNDVINKPQRHSFLPIEYPMVVPGGRFRESYYWDSYWIIKGLLISDMGYTSVGIVKNFFNFVQDFGFIPNGGRIYYLTRSQPPFLSEMITEIYDWGYSENNEINTYWPTDLYLTPYKFLKDGIEYLEIEYNWWMNEDNNHIIDIIYNNNKYQLNRYYGNTSLPRPESYSEDVTNGEKNYNLNHRSKELYYKEVASGAETGWDFSSRWIIKNESNAYPIYSLNTTNIIPVDLNTILYRYELNIARIYELLEYPEYYDYHLPPLNQTEWMSTTAQYYYSQSLIRLNSIQSLLWDENNLRWYDFNVEENRLMKEISSISNYIPIWGNLIENNEDLSEIKNDIIKCFNDSDLIQIAGIVTTNISTGQQWDNPNLWPPLQSLIINGLDDLNTIESKVLSKQLALTFLNTAYKGWKETGYMDEKYNAYIIGYSGSGGEYNPQVGFGWTNGVVLELLSKYGNDI